MSEGDSVVAFSGRAGGVSVAPFESANISTRVGDDPAAVAENRRRLLDALGVVGATMVTARQVHGATVLPVSGVRAGQADGLVTRERNLVLTVGVADCVPVALTSPAAVGMLHVGWRGLVAGIVHAGMAALHRIGGRSVTAYVGPSVGSCCYPVGEDVWSAVVGRYPSAGAVSLAGERSLDLGAAVTEALHRAGVAGVVRIEGCTAHEPDRYFSVRRDGRTGCQAGMAVLREG
ncbi:polyphenol oxidase family protein [Actinophytocola sp.]|uniref:polyphenol oxidase family protein n=1 Tax=Actinophytocola sp. TaxID=1872138 RepID=UPI0025C32144|nr:polyphenol oxidase family protein [Actinophytocola sp.]